MLVSLAAKAIRPDVASRWLLKAGAKAKLPKITGGLVHPYRRLWDSERKMLPDVDVAAAGGWRDTQALKLSYQQSDAAPVLSVVEHRARGDTIWTQSKYGETP